MATIQELREKITVIDNQIAKLQQAKREVKSEQKDAIQASFEAEHGVKPGDPIQTRSGETMFYEASSVYATLPRRTERQARQYAT